LSPAPDVTDLKVVLSGSGGTETITDANDDGNHTDGIIQLRNHNFPGLQATIISIDIGGKADPDGYNGFVITSSADPSIEAVMPVDPGVVGMDVTGNIDLGTKLLLGKGRLDGTVRGTNKLQSLSLDTKGDGKPIGTFSYTDKTLPFTFNDSKDKAKINAGNNKIEIRATMALDFGNDDQTLTLPASIFVGVEIDSSGGPLSPRWFVVLAVLIAALGVLVVKSKR
jgi:hypothetical protein